MNEKKKLNLLPPEAKNKYANKYLKFTAAIFVGFFILLLLIQYCQIGILSIQTNKILTDNQKYNKEQQTIKALKENIANYEAFLNDYRNECFPFSLFMYDLEVHRPSDVYIISVDSSERLINEGVQDEGTEAKKKNTEENSDKKTEEKTMAPKIEYIEDLSGREIVIRGFGNNQESISEFVYDIAHFSYISNVEITSIEEHSIEDGIYNIFEIKVTGGVYR